MAISFPQWSADNLPTFIETIRSMLTSNDSTIPIVIYFHCECGCDRTGEVAGSYYMQYQGYSYKEAHALDVKIAGREMLIQKKHGLIWFCEYLKYAKNYSLECESGK